MAAATRRRFLGSLSLVPLLPQTLVAPPAPPTPGPAAPAPAPPAAEEPGPVAEALADAARARYGSHYEAGDDAEVRRAIGRALRRAERLRKGVSLGNADAPVTLFQARPPAGGAGSR